MRITKISFKGLFGMFDHEIPLNQESRITIIHGPNGVGKTVLMELVHALFHYDYDFLNHIPFEQFHIDFHNGNSLIVKKSDSGDTSEGNTILLVLYINDSGEEIDSFTIRIANNDFFNKLVKRFHPELAPATTFGSTDETWYWIAKDDKYMDTPNLLEPLTKQDILRRNPEIHEEACGVVPDWFATIQQNTSPYLISIARLTSPAWGISFFASWEWNRKGLQEDGGIFMVPSRPDAVTEIQKGFKSNRILMKKISFGDKWMREIEEFQAELAERTGQASETVTDYLQEGILFREEQLKEYNKDIEYRTGKLYCDLLNQRILFKFLKLDGEEGIKAHLDDGIEVPLTTLSSGEQQLLVLYYQLLFEIQPDTLVMIDEPELSMNVVWQRNFLKDLQRIIELRKFDVLIATHSPEVIFDKWDWTVALGEKVDD